MKQSPNIIHKSIILHGVGNLFYILQFFLLMSFEKYICGPFMVHFVCLGSLDVFCMISFSALACFKLMRISHYPLFLSLDLGFFCCCFITFPLLCLCLHFMSFNLCCELIIYEFWKCLQFIFALSVDIRMFLKWQIKSVKKLICLCWQILSCVVFNWVLFIATRNIISHLSIIL